MFQIQPKNTNFLIGFHELLFLAEIQTVLVLRWTWGKHNIRWLGVPFENHRILLTSKSLSFVSTGLSNVLHFLDVPRNSVPSIQIPYDPSEEPKTSVSRSQRTKNEFWPDHLNWSSSKNNSVRSKINGHEIGRSWWGEANMAGHRTVQFGKRSVNLPGLSWFLKRNKKDSPEPKKCSDTRILWDDKPPIIELQLV